MSYRRSSVARWPATIGAGRNFIDLRGGEGMSDRELRRRLGELEEELKGSVSALIHC